MKYIYVAMMALSLNPGLCPKLRAGEAREVKTGSMVRIVTHGFTQGRIVGTVTAIRPDTIEVLTSDQQRAIGFSEISIIEVRRRQNNTLKGGAYGFIGGAIVGSFLVRGNSENDLADRDAALLGSAALAVPGFIVGLIAGSTTNKDGWHLLSVDDLRNMN